MLIPVLKFLERTATNLPLAIRWCAGFLQLDVDPHLVASDTNILVPVSEVQNVSTKILAANDSNGSVAFKRRGANSGWVIDLLMLCRQVRLSMICVFVP
jgi:hypothetical protein